MLITIADDGRGLDRARIRGRAEEQGLLPPGARLTDSELFQLIFQPGFSTAREVTSLSGRGVGMDVVRRTIDGAARQHRHRQHAPAQGTEITLRLPLTLAIIDGLLVRVGDGRYVIPLSAVEECVELSAEDDAPLARPQLPQHPRRAGAVPAAARAVRHRARRPTATRRW